MEWKKRKGSASESRCSRLGQPCLSFPIAQYWETKTGKTEAGKYIANQLDAVRICAYEGMSRNILMRAVAQAILGAEAGTSTTWVSKLAAFGNQESECKKLIIVDEANKLKWQQLEALRFLSDECGFALILIGTELYSNQFKQGKSKALLLQLGRRIGAKRTQMTSMSKKEMAGFLMVPRFGKVSQALANQFWVKARRGNWGEGNELANACARIMRSNGVSSLNETVLAAAIKWQATGTTA